MSTGRLAGVGLIALLAWSGGCRREGQGQPVRQERLGVFCAAGLRAPIEELIPAFEQAHSPAKVRIDYGGTGELLGRIKTVSSPEYRPDVFVAAEETYARQAETLGLVDRSETIAYFIPVIVVGRDNPRNVQGLADLARPDVRVVLGESRGPAIGLVTDQILAKADLSAVRGKAVATYATVQQVATAVVLGHADAAIIWDATARQGDFRDTLRMIAVPFAPRVHILICRIAGGRNQGLADEFIELARSGRAREAFQRHGYTVEPGPSSPASQPDRPPAG